MATTAPTTTTTPTTATTTATTTTITSDAVENMNSQYLLAVHFEGLVVSSKSSLHKSSMSKIWNTGVKSETNVKRMVKIQKSTPFVPGGRPDR
jgi:hypothetical protein